MPSRRNYWCWTLTAAAVGVALRALYVLVFVRGRMPLYGDAWNYHHLGGLLADGHGYVQVTAYLDRGELIPTAEFPPLYPMLLALVDLIGIGSSVGQRLVGAVLGGVTIVVIGLLGAAVAGRTVGIIAAWIAALYPQLVLIDGSLMSEGLYVLIIALLLLSVVHARAAESARLRMKWWTLASVMLGLAVMTRTEALLLLPLLLVPATRVVGDRRAWARAAAVGCAGAVCMTGAWTVRNSIALDHFQPLTNNGGSLLAGANCKEVYSGVFIGSWRFDCIPASSSRDETVRLAEARDVGIAFMRDHADELPAVVAARLGRTFGAWDIRSSLVIEQYQGRDYHWLWAAWFIWLALAPVAVLGAVVHRRAGRELWPLLASVVTVVLVTMTTYGSQRFRAAAEPSIIVLAAVGLVACVSRVRRTASRSMGRAQDSVTATAV